MNNPNFTERAYHVFVATQAEEKLRREGIRSKTKASQAQHEVQAKVRQTIRELSGTMTEDLSTPEKSTRQLERGPKKVEGGE
jgi:DNA-damage-inducible protein D